MNGSSCLFIEEPRHGWRRQRRLLNAFLATLSALLSLPAAALDMELLWTADPDMILEGAPMVVDLDGDGAAEILTAAYENMIVVDGGGKERWRFDTRGRYSTCPAILERPGQLPLIYAGDNQGMFTCLDGAGQIVWQKDMGSVFGASPALADLNGDGLVEVIQADQAGVVLALDALSGAPVWESRVEAACGSPAIGDLDGDGRLETVFTTGAGKAIALDASGNTIWTFTLGGAVPLWAIASPVIFANASGQVSVAAASNEGRFFCLDGGGKVRWERATRGAIASTISAGDFDADGRADVFAVTQLGVVYRFDEDGRTLWELDTQGRSLASGAIIDLDGDGILEYLLCTQQGNLLAFSNAGEVAFNYQFDNRTINMTPAFGDIVKSRPGLEFAVTGGESGRLFCFGTGASTDTPAPWRTYRGNNRMTGAWLGLARADTIQMTAENLNWDQLFTGGGITFRVQNPAPGDDALNAEAVCLGPDGSRQAAVGKVVGRSGLLQLPVSVRAPGEYQFTWALKNAANATLATGARALTLLPYQNDQALAQRAALALHAEIGEGSGSETDRGLRGAMIQESSAIGTEAGILASLQAAAPGSDAAFGEQLDTRTAALNARAKRGLALAAVAPSVLGDASNSQMLAFEGKTWENRDVDKALPPEAVAPLRIARRCITGEHEPVSIKLMNVTLDTLTVGVRVAAVPGGPTVTAHEVKPVPTNQGTIAWDPLVVLNQDTVAIPSLETREVWLDIDLSGVKPGPCAIEVFFDTGASEAKAEIMLDVIPFTMAGFGAMRLCCWSTNSDAAIKDLLAHGNNVFIGTLPPAAASEGSAAAITIDYTALDAFMARLAGHDVYLLMGGIPALGVPVESEDYVPRLAGYLEQVMAHLAALGIDEDHVALYPHDEPGGAGWDTVNHYVTFGRQGLKARPGLKFYVNGGGDLAMFEALNEVAAIWCPGFNMLSEKTPEMDFLRKCGKTLWSYDCTYSYARPIGANVKTINVAAAYRMEPVFGFNFGATGIGYWCHDVGPSMWDPIDLEYPLVYTNPDGTQTSSRRWEAVREGMEDTRILIALREKLADPSVGAEAKEKIRRLLDVTVPAIANQTLDELHLGVARYVLDASNNDETVERLRGDMMDCVALLAGRAR